MNKLKHFLHQRSGFFIVAIGLFITFLSIPQTTYSASTQIAYGDLIEASIDGVGEVDAYTFSGGAGDKVIIRMRETSGDFEPRLELFAPDDTLLTEVWSYVQADIFDYTLPTSGTYTIFASDNGGNATGNYWLSLQCRQQIKANAATISYDSYIEESVNPIGDMDAYTFSGSAGDKVIIRMRETSGDFEPRLELFAPDDTLLTEVWSYVQADILDYTLPTSGTYTIFVSDNGGNATGNYWLSLQTPHLLTIGQPLSNQQLAWDGDASGIRFR
jgi:hypothetical protein